MGQLKVHKHRGSRLQLHLNYNIWYCTIWWEAGVHVCRIWEIISEQPM